MTRRDILTRIKCGLAWGLIALSMAAAIVFILTYPKVRADEQQDYIHKFHRDCCPHNRCFPVAASPSLHFWNVEGFYSIVPLGAERRWHFPETYGCAYEQQPTIVDCLFMPWPEGS